MEFGLFRTMWTVRIMEVSVLKRWSLYGIWSLSDHVDCTY